MTFARSSQSIKIGKSDLIDIDCIWKIITQQARTSKANKVRCKSKNENCWIHANSKFVDNWISTEIKQLSLFLKKNIYIAFFKTRFKFLLLMADIGQVCSRPVFHDLDLPPFQNNFGLVPGVVTSGSSQ